MLRLPGLIDPHVHVREPGQTHKEDWDTVTQSALAGGVTVILAMPNTKPPIFDATTLDLALAAAKVKARCDYAQYLGAGPENAAEVARIAHFGGGGHHDPVHQQEKQTAAGMSKPESRPLPVSVVRETTPTSGD